MTNPYSGDPSATSPSVEAGTTQSEQPVSGAVAPSAPPDVNPDVVSQSPAAASEHPVSGDDTTPERPSLLDRLRALEVRVFGQTHPADDGTEG